MTSPDITDLRSDTVTRPTPEMRRAIAEAEVGDDVFGDDPTVRRLEETAAERLGKEAGLFTPSGTMANQVAIQVWCDPGDEVWCHEESHVHLWENAGVSALAGCMPRTVPGERGVFGPDDLARLARPHAYYLSKPGLVTVENTFHGCAWPLPRLAETSKWAREHDLPVHMDGARLFNAAVACETSPADIVAHVDSATFCLSKGLGAPVGSVLCGPEDFIAEGRAVRKMLGGGMRQAGILAAAGLHALEHHVERLAEDHARCRRLAEAWHGLDGISCDPDGVDTNILFAQIDPDVVPGGAPGFAERLAADGVWIIPLGDTEVRAVTHLDVDDADLERAVDASPRAAAG